MNRTAGGSIQEVAKRYVGSKPPSRLDVFRVQMAIFFVFGVAPSWQVALVGSHSLGDVGNLASTTREHRRIQCDSRSVALRIPTSVRRDF